MQEHKEWFYDDFKIDIAYGCPLSCIWNGGRVEGGRRYIESEVRDVFAFYKKNNVEYRLNFTNQCLQEQDLQDEYGNMIAKVANEFGVKVAITLPMMAQYLQDNYSNLQITWSTSTCYGETEDEIIEKINQLSAKTAVVLPYTFNNKEELKKFLHPQNLEVLVCDSCLDNCPRRRLHQKLVSQSVINREFNEKINSCLLIQEVEEGNLSLEEYQKLLAYDNVVKRDVFYWYLDKKINRFKISGRTGINNALAAYVYYFVKQEYKNEYIDMCEQDMREIGIIEGTIMPDTYYISAVSREEYQVIQRLLDDTVDKEILNKMNAIKLFKFNLDLQEYMYMVPSEFVELIIS